MRLYTDYGLLLLGQESTGEVRHCFYDFPLDRIVVVGPG
jgi:hypothetical protein